MQFQEQFGDLASRLTLILEHSEPVYADFSNNSSLSVVPELSGDLMGNPDGQGGYFKNPVTFKLLWIDMGLRFTVELPEEYANVTLGQYIFNSNLGPWEQSNQNGRVLTTNLFPLNHVVSELACIGRSITLVFGMTDSTYFTMASDFFPHLASHPHVRSSKLTQWTIYPPPVDKVVTYISTIEYFNDDIIQVYAGADNLPYTNDDIIVLEPRYWERINVYVDEKTE